MQVNFQNLLSIQLTVISRYSSQRPFITPCVWILLANWPTSTWALKKLEALANMGPKEVGGSSDPYIQELTPLPSATAQGAKTAGKGYLISLGSGVVVFAAIAALDQGDGFAVLLGVLTGLLVASVGAAISLAAGLIKGTKVALDNRAEIQQREARRNSSPPSNTQFVVEPVDERLVPAEFTTALKQAIGR